MSICGAFDVVQILHLKQAFCETIRLNNYKLTNNPKKVVGLEGYGLEIVERIPIEVPLNRESAFYMQTKKDKMGHLLTQDHILKPKESEIGKNN